MTDYATRVEQHMATCRECSNLAPHAKDAARQRIHSEILRTQSRNLTPLPLAAWPAGQPWKETTMTTELRDQIAATHGITDEDRDILMTGTDEATLTAQAERLSGIPKLSQGNRAPREGYTVNAPDPDESSREYVRAIFGGSDDILDH